MLTRFNDTFIISTKNEIKFWLIVKQRINDCVLRN